MLLFSGPSPPLIRGEPLRRLVLVLVACTDADLAPLAEHWLAVGARVFRRRMGRDPAPDGTPSPPAKHTRKLNIFDSFIQLIGMKKAG